MTHFTNYLPAPTPGFALHIAIGLLPSPNSPHVIPSTSATTDIPAAVLRLIDAHHLDLLTFAPYCLGSYDDTPEPTCAFTVLTTDRTTELHLFIHAILSLAHSTDQDYLGVIGLTPGRTLLNVRTGELV